MADKFPLQVTNATLASGDNTVVASAAGQAIKVYQLLIAAGANADTVTLKFTLAGSAQTAVISVPVNTTIRCHTQEHRGPTVTRARRSSPIQPRPQQN